ncbi:MAG: 50S ribosomal protein L5 [Candidatus Mcinerneyibacterium aminivorans]|jgi:large subunit ribosomal protein L5|uniref:Large ribosomal subunit protein uL5 n=1 Tax=Candidatus Mcinerneyibacterium aminivorans TaxID=2703815 RepID=A0A5D0MIT1_9BACT|nr:MAG: 50S ribosomal protein L5 [Candidatus Mcinerneyibacterium aminivorans]
MELELKKFYKDKVREYMMEEYGYDNVMEVPKVKKISVNMGVGEASRNKKVLERAIDEIRTITGQEPVIRNAKKSISNFNIRKGMPVGVSVTLRQEKMWSFLMRLIDVALPRIRDFKGVPKNAFDGRGNYTFGLPDQIVFPEINAEAVDSIRGMNVTIVTTAETDEEGRALLRSLGMPFEKK